MKEITLTQDEFIVLAHLMKSDKLMLYAGSGLQGKIFTQKLEDKNFEVTNTLLKKGLVSLVGEDLIKNKVKLKRDIFILKNMNNYVYSNDVQLMKKCSEKVEYEIDILENRIDYSICVNKITVSSEGYMSIIFNEDTKIFHLEIADKNEKMNFFSKQLQIPLSCTLNEEDAYIISLKSGLFEKLIDAYTSNDREHYIKLAHQLGREVESSMDYLKSTLENNNYTDYAVINSKKKDELTSIRIFNNMESYFICKSQNGKKKVEVAKQGLSGIIEFFRP